MRSKRLFWTALLLGGAAVSTGATPGRDFPRTDAVFALHVAAPTTKTSTICTTYSPLDPAHPGGQLSCSSFNVHGALCTPYLVYLVVAKVDTDGVAGVSLGLDYNGDAGRGVDVTAWTLCSDGLEFRSTGPRGEWPESGGGTRIVWVTCQKTVNGSDGVQAVMGALEAYAYSSDRLKITPNRPLDSGPELHVANCDGAEAQADSVLHVGWAGFGNWWGCNPCPYDCFADAGERTESPEPPSGPCPAPARPSTWGRIKSLFP
jgi:hypothetical protein